VFVGRGFGVIGSGLSWDDPVISTPEADPDRSTPILRERIRTLFKPLPKALVGDPESIHDLRVAGRRLRVALPLLARKPAGRRVRRAGRILADLTRGAGGSRDLDVSLELLARRIGRLDHKDPALLVLRRRLRGARARSRHRMAEAVLDLEIATLRRDLRAVVARRGERLFTVLVRLRAIRDRRGTRLVTRLEGLGDRFDPLELHRLRIACRRLRYLAELGRSLTPQRSDDDAIVLFKKQQELLGGIHDAYVLSSWFANQEKSARRRGQLTIASAAAREATHFLERSRQLHRDYLDTGPLDMVSRALRSMGFSRTAA
jgi:CHAD domain-containing protein